MRLCSHIFFLVTILTTTIHFSRHWKISKNILYLKHQVLILINHIFLFMKVCHKNKTKVLLPGVQKILLVAYALFKEIFEPSSLKSLKYIHGSKQQIHSLSRSSWQYNCGYFLYATTMVAMKYEPYQLVSIRWLKITGLV